jgi:phosphodiesterase/alkaline phosphatase D-like protein
VTSADAAGNTTTSEIKSFETRAAPDHVSPLVLSGPVVSGITQNECTIGWTTNEISTTVLEYGLDESYGSFWEDSATDVGHQVQLLDLIEDTTYFFRFYSTDASGNSSSPRVGTFHTLATPDVDAPVITSGPLATGITDHGAVVKWRSDEVADTHLRLSTTLDFAVTETDLDEALDFDHLVDIGNLLPYTTYFYEIQSTDGTGNASEVILRSFRTLAEPDLLAPAIVLGPVVTALSNTTAQIEWDSDEDAVASLTYLEEGLEVTLSSADLKRIHAVVLSGLLPATAYEYWITLADGSGNNSLSPHFGFTTLESPDTTSPAIIKGPFVSIVLHDQAVVEWQTDESSDSSLEYGLTTGAGESVAGADVVQEHMIRLTGLQPGSIYHYRVLSRDTNGNEPTVSAIHTFETLAAPDTVAPEITASAVVVERSDQSASIGWSTNELAAGFVEYGVGPEFGSVAVSADLVGEHLLRLTHLEPATQYHFRVGSTDLVGNGPTYGAANTFFTKSQPDLLPPVIEVQPFIAGLTQTTATIEWVSDEPSDSQVKYWITGSAEVTEKVLPEDVTSHSVVLGNLLPATEYNLEISSTDAAGNGPTGGDAVLFTTPADADTIAPVILSGPTVTGITESSATVEWTTDEQSTTVLDHGTKRAYELGHTEDADRVTTHVVTLTGLSGNRTYHFRIESTDESGNTVDSDPGGTRQHNRDHKFKTLKAGDTDSPVFLEGPIVYAKARRATLLWRTDEAVNYELTYGTSASLDGPDAETREENHLRKRHSVSLARLVKGTSYFYRLRVRDRAGNETIAATPGAALPPGAAAKVLQAAGDGSFLTAETVDTQAPMLVSLPRLTATTQTTFTVEWETDEPSDSYISYGVEQPDEARHGSAFHLVEHRVTLTNLVAGVTYVFHTGSTDASGNGETVSPLAVATTDTELDLIPPSITSGPEIVYRSDDTVTLEWSTDEPSTSVVNYGQEGLDLLSELSDMSRVHNITLTNLIPSSEYVY